MPTLAVALLVAAAQQLPTGTGLSSPQSGDTSGYWQQGVHYTISATLDERARRVRASATLRYVNNSPDTLREMYFHQYLNAFRPGSRWSAVDQREGRVRFQRLEDPDFGYERFTAPLRVNGTPVAVTYPGAPDSTVARVAMPRPMAPGDTTLVALEWDARPSTVPRRQGRRGRHWDLAQWYPKVAVYDRGGWQHNPLQPAGEFYGEFGTYDVVLLVAEDQVLAATGVPVSGDPGWGRVMRAGVERRNANAYGALPDRAVSPPAGFKAVRFVARDVHHFAWSAATDFRYEGGVYARPLPPSRFRTWDSVAIHVLYRPGDDTTWGGQRVVRRTINAMQWLERIYGPYAYPQMSVVHRLDGGGTEFPMMQQNGSPSQGLILHEGGHVWSYGILANNEWRSAWLDEGLTSYQTAWAQQLTPYERFVARIVDHFPPPEGYRARAAQMRLPRFESLNLGQTFADLQGESEPMGTIAHEFRDFSTYNDMVYSRAEVMYGQLRDVLGDTAFVAFLRDYYSRWALRHVDERAMRASAERVSGTDLGWFFDQWVHRTGIMDYRLSRVRIARDSGGGWMTDAHVRREGEYRHPVRVGVRTSTGWTFGRLAEAPYDRGIVRIRTMESPLETRIDPLHLSWDWDRRNDARPRRMAKYGIDWPWLRQADRERQLELFAPTAWYSDAGGIAAGLRHRSNYLGLVDLSEGGLAYATDPRVPLSSAERLQYWFRLENPYLSPFMTRPAMGWHGSLANLDGVSLVDIGRMRQYSAGARTRTYDVALTFADVMQPAFAPELWTDTYTVDLSARARWSIAGPGGGYWFIEPGAVAGMADRSGYAKVEAAVGAVRTPAERTRVAIRLYGGYAEGVPGQRGLFLSAQDPIATFENHWWRPRGALLKRPGFNFLPLGGAGLRGYAAGVPVDGVVAVNVDLSRRLARLPGSRTLALWAHAFGDAAHASDLDVIGDAGVGIGVRGRLYDRVINVRIDAPFFVSKPELGIGRSADPSAGRAAGCWVITFNDLW